MICSARGENRAHESIHLLLRSSPPGSSCGGRRSCFPCPLVHSEVLAPGQSRVPSLSVLRSPRALTFGYGCAVHVGVDVLLGAGDAEVDVIYITFIMSAQYTGYLVLYKVRYNWATDVVCTDTGFRQGSTKPIPL